VKLSREDLKELSKLWFNPISIVGFCMVVCSVVMIVALLLVQMMFSYKGTYSGLVTFIILPPFCFLGLILIPLGIYRQHRILHKTGERPKRHFTIDFNLARHRNVFIWFLIATSFVVIIVSALSAQAFFYSESTEFCSTCHSVMAPESTTHKESPHSRVRCVECHVGEGTGWYVKSKMSGLYQVYSTIFKKYSKPIETPIHNLRPARDTCEHCHWPKFFIEDKLVNYTYYLPDEDNTEGSISLLMKVGGIRDHHEPTGIHWHIANQVEYIATDTKKQNIPWIRVTDDEGKQVVFQSNDEPLPEETIASSDIQIMDCIDCHNRPSHIYQSPEKIMNKLLFSGKVSPDLPEIRSLGSELLRAEYESTDQAVQAIEEGLRGAYAEDEEIAESMKDELNHAVEAIVDSYRKNFFPEMKTRWDVHVSNIGHKMFPGCFRCHDDNHESESGAVIRRDCNLCHTIVAQSESDLEGLFDPNGLDFIHPEDDEEWMETMCHECHTGE